MHCKKQYCDENFHRSIMPEKIASFLASNHLLSLATWSVDEPYAASCFYAFDKKNYALIFASSQNTKHMQLITQNPNVAGTIALCEEVVHTIQGVQFKGVVKEASKEQEMLYLRRFPIAVAMQPMLWALELTWVKMTDNTLGFKTKISWSR